MLVIQTSKMCTNEHSITKGRPAPSGFVYYTMRYFAEVFHTLAAKTE